MTAPEQPAPPPEAVLVRDARKARGLSPERAAAATPIRLKGGRWRQIEAGYERLRPTVKTVTAPAATLAHMAHVVGISADRLEEVGRADAAGVLREIQSGGTTIEPVVVTQRLSELVRERRSELGLSLTETSARSIDPESGSTQPVWSPGDLAELEADEDPRPPRIREIRALAGALALPVRVVQDATSVQFSGLTVVWHPDMTKRVMVDGWFEMSPGQRAEVVAMLDRWTGGDT